MGDGRWRRIDWIVLGCALAIAGLGLVFLRSANPAFFGKQIQWLAMGLAALAFMFAVPYQRWVEHAWEIYGGALALLVIVLGMPAINHAHSWIKVPGLGFQIQPAEIMKLALILVLARFLMHREDQPKATGLIAPFLLMLIPMGLILKQPDLGTALLLPPTLLCVVYASGARLAHLAAVCASGLFAAVPMWFLMKGYQKRRVLAFLDPESYEAHEAYQLLMSLAAIGSGGWTGQGLGRGTQNSLSLLPEKHNDFIFGVIAEEGGFVTAAALMALFLLMIWAGLHIARNTREPAGRLIAVGVTCMLGIQVIINIGVVTASLPTTGITLPLVSYGGSSMLVTFAMIGLLLNVGASRPIVMRPESFTGALPA